MEETFDLAEARAALSLLVDRDHSVLLRSLPSGSGRILPGSLDNLSGAIRSIEPGSSGIHYTLNPLSTPPGGVRKITAEDVVYRRWLMIDLDPVRPADTSATKQEHEAAHGRAGLIFEYLRGKGWPEPLKVDSGNGAHLLYRVELPESKESQELLKKCLQTLADKFNDHQVEIDTSVHNSTRLGKLPGTWARKGNSTTERPHRMARLMGPAPELESVSRELLEQLVAPPHEKNGRSPFKGNATGETIQDGRRYAERALSLEVERLLSTSKHRNEALNKAAFALGQLVASGHLTREEVERELSTAAKVIGLDSWEIPKTIASGLEASAKSPRIIPERNGSHKPGKNGSSPPPPLLDPASVAAGWLDICQILSLHLPPPSWAVPGILSEGLTILAGKPKLGKSFLALNLALTIAAGGKALNHVDVEAGDVLYLTLEDRMRRVQQRARKILAGQAVEPSQRLTVGVECPRMNQGGLEAVEQWISTRKNPRLVIIDVWAKFRPLSTKSNSNAYGQDYEDMGILKSFADHHKVSVLVLHHCKKAAAEDQVDEVSGTLGLAGSADGIAILTRARSENEASLYITGRDVTESTLALSFDPVSFVWSCDGTSEDRSRSQVRNKVLEALKQAPGGLFVNELAELLDLVPATVKKECWRMNGEGYIRKVGSKYLWPGDVREDQDRF